MEENPVRGDTKSKQPYSARLFRQKNPKIAQIIPRRSGFDCIAQFLKERIRIAPPKIIARIEPQPARAPRCFPIGNSPSRRTRSINTIRAHAKNSNPPPRNFLHAIEYERQVPSADSVPRHRRTHFAIRDHRRAPPRIRALQFVELRQQKIRSPLDGPVIGSVIANGNESRFLAA